MAARIFRYTMLLSIVIPSTCVLPGYFSLPAHAERDDIIDHFFHLGLGYSEILMCLFLLHGICLSIRQLKRILRCRGLGRRANRTDPRQVCEAIEEELRGSGSTIGYRQMTQRLVVDHGLVVGKETVRELMKILDPYGVSARSSRRLRRRQYSTKGPNHIWHIDGYDKLKPFGFCVQGLHHLRSKDRSPSYL